MSWSWYPKAHAVMPTRARSLALDAGALQHVIDEIAAALAEL